MQILNTIFRVLLVTVVSTPALAQSTDPVPDGSQIPVRTATATPAVGEVAVDENGAVASVFFEETRICTIKGCRVFIFDKRSGALIHNDGLWIDAYAQTGRGLQIIRVKEFHSTEAPQPTPSDSPLEDAPAITEVVRPQEKSSP